MSDSAAARVFAFIFVRGGSKGLPGKNLRKLGDRSLLAHSIAVARACRHIERTIVSTDDEDLAHEAEQHGAEVPFIRPASLAQDNSPEWLAWQHAIRAVESDPKFGPFQCFVSVPATAPLRAVQDVEACIDLLLGTDSDVVVTASKARHHPAFNMLRLDERGVASVYAPLDSVLSTRQSAPPAYDMTTVAYAARPSWILRARNLWDGTMRAVVVPHERAVDIDDEFDLQFAEYLMQRRDQAG